MSVQSASFAVLKSGTKQLYKVTGEWIAEYCKDSDLFTVCRVNFEGDPVNHWVRFEDIYDKLEDDDWLVCTDTDGVTYKVSGRDFYKTKEPLRFIKIKNPVIAWDSPQPGGVMYVEKHTTTINGTEPVTHKGNWGYRENGGIGPTDRSWRGNSNETVRGIAFEPGTGNGLAIVNSLSKATYITTNDGKTWTKTQATSSPMYSEIKYEHEVFWLPRQKKFAQGSYGNVTSFFLMELNESVGPTHVDRVKGVKVSLDSFSGASSSAYCTFIDDDISYKGTATDTDLSTPGWGLITIKTDPMRDWSSGVPTMKLMVESGGSDGPMRAGRQGDWFYFYVGDLVYKISISQSRANNKIKAVPFMRRPDTPFAMVNLPFVDEPSMMIAGGSQGNTGGLEDGTMEWIYLVRLNDKSEMAKTVIVPNEHSFTSRVRTSCSMNAESELALSDYNGNISVTSDGVHFEFIKNSFPSWETVRALAFNEPTGKVAGGLHIGGTGGHQYVGTTSSDGGYDLFSGQTNPASYRLKDSDINKSIGWVETTEDSDSRKLLGASAPSPKINLYGKASDIAEHPEIIDLTAGQIHFKSGFLTEENMNLGSVKAKYRPFNWDSVGDKYKQDVKYNNGYANSTGWHFGDPSVAWPVIKQEPVNSSDSNLEKVWSLTPTTDDNKIVFLFKIYKAQFSRNVLNLKGPLIKHESVNAGCCIRAICRDSNTRAAHLTYGSPSNNLSCFVDGPFEAVVLDVPKETLIVSDQSDLTTGEEGDIAIIQLVTADTNPLPVIYSFSGGSWGQLSANDAAAWIQSQRLDLKPVVFDGVTPDGSYFNVVPYQRRQAYNCQWSQMTTNLSSTGMNLSASVGVNGISGGVGLKTTDFIGTGFSISVNYNVQSKSYTAVSEKVNSKQFHSKPEMVVEASNVYDASTGKYQTLTTSEGTRVNTAPYSFAFGDLDEPVIIRSELEYSSYDESLVDPTSTWRPIDESLINTVPVTTDPSLLKRGVWRDDQNNPVLQTGAGTVLINGFGTSTTGKELGYLNEFSLSGASAHACYSASGGHLCNRVTKGIDGKEYFYSYVEGSMGYKLDTYTYDPSHERLVAIKGDPHDLGSNGNYSSNWTGGSKSTLGNVSLSTLNTELRGGVAGLALADPEKTQSGATLGCAFGLEQKSVKGSGWNAKYTHYGTLLIYPFGGSTKSINIQSLSKNNQTSGTVAHLRVVQTAAVLNDNDLIGYYLNVSGNNRHFTVDITGSSPNDFPDYNAEQAITNIKLDSSNLPQGNVIQSACLLDEVITVVIANDPALTYFNARDHFDSTKWMELPDKKPSYILATANATTPGDLTSVPLPAGWSDFSVFAVAEWPERVCISNGTDVMAASPEDWNWVAIESELTATLAGGQEIIHFTPRTERVHGYAGIAAPGDTELVQLSTLPNVVAGPLIDSSVVTTTATVKESWEKQVQALPPGAAIKSLTCEVNP